MKIRWFIQKLSVDPVDDMTVLVDWTHIKGQPLNVSIYNEAGKLFHLRKISNKIPKILHKLSSQTWKRHG